MTAKTIETCQVRLRKESRLLDEKSKGLASTVGQAWRRLTRGLGYNNNIRFDDLRHSHATLMVKAGVHTKIVQERLGYSSIAITLDTYSHVMPGMQHQAAETFAKMLQPKISWTAPP